MFFTLNKTNELGCWEAGMTLLFWRIDKIAIMLFCTLWIMAKHLHFKVCVGAMHVAFQCKSKLERANQSFSRVQMFLKIISNSRFDLKGKIGRERKTRQNAENKQTFDLTRIGKNWNWENWAKICSIISKEKLVKTLKINKLLILIWTFARKIWFVYDFRFWMRWANQRSTSLNLVNKFSVDKNNRVFAGQKIFQFRSQAKKLVFNLHGTVFSKKIVLAIFSTPLKCTTEQNWLV